MGTRLTGYLSFRLLRLAFATALLVGAVSGAAIAQGSLTLRSKAADVDTLLAKAASPAGVRVIVTLRGATGGTLMPRGSSSTQQAPPPDTRGPLGDGQLATVEQARILAGHIGPDDVKRQRWSPRLIPNTPYMAMTVTTAELEALAADSDVVSIHEDGQLGTGLQDSVPLVGIDPIRTPDATGANMLVAILDTGVEYGHVFLTPRVIGASCFSTTSATFATLCPNGLSTQSGGNAGINCGVPGCEHGTHVAGIAAGNRAAGTPPQGVAKTASIFSSQVFSRRISDNALVAFDSDVLASLNDLLTRINANEFAPKKVAAINLSIADPTLEVTGNCDTVARGIPFKSVVDSLKTAKVATVISSGNGSKTNMSAFPGCISTAITVSSTTKSDVVSAFSNVSTIVDLFAPGSSITSSVPPTSSFAVFDGTSMAAPHVTGAIAAILSTCPSASIDKVGAALSSTGRPITDSRLGGVFTKPRLRVDAAVQREAFAKLPDFNGDLRSDIPWRQTSGAVAVWLLNGASILSAAGVGSPGTDWHLIGEGDFNGDLKSDFLWRHEDGSVAVWLMNGSTLVTGAVVGSPVTTDWRVVGAGDLNGDGKSDIVWRHSSGAVAVWFMNGTTVASFATLGTVARTWRLIGIGDFNGDGRSDILWRHDSGTVAVWLMNGTAVLLSAALGSPAYDWRVVGVGDLNGDGKSDILWRQDLGSVAVWLVNGGAVLSSTIVGTSGNDWHVAGGGDLNGDGKSDIVWRHDSGVVAVWFMNGAVFVSAAGISPGGTDWDIVAGQHDLHDLVGSGQCGG